MTLSLSAIFQILELYRPYPARGCLTCGFQAGEALPCKACLHGRLSAIVALSPPCYRAANAGENDGWKCAKDRLDRHGPHGLPHGRAAAQGRPRRLDLEPYQVEGRAAGEVRREDRGQAVRAGGLRCGVLDRLDRERPGGGLFRRQRRDAWAQQRTAESVRRLLHY